MASNIRVVLEVDNKKYLNDVKTAERATKQFAESSERSINKLDKTIDGVSKQFGRLKTVLAGAAFAAIGRSVFALADELDDLSNSTGIAVGRLVEFRTALEQSGGAPTDATTGIIKFTQAINDAAEGSIQAQNKFLGLGLTLEQLRTQSDEQFMISTLEELAKMEAGAQRTALMVEFFGKSFRTVNPRQLLDELKATRGEGDAYAASVAKAAELNGKLEKAFANLRLALLSGFAPIIEQFSKFADTLSRSKEEIDSLITTVKLLAVALAAVGAVGGLLLVVRYIGVIGRGAAAIITALGKFRAPIAATADAAGQVAAKTRTWGQALTSAFRVSGGFLTALRGMVVLIGSIGAGIYTASQLFDNFGDAAMNILSRVTEGVISLIGSLGGAGLGAALGSALGPLGTLLGGLAGGFAGDKLADVLGADDLVKKLRDAREERERIAKLDQLNKNRLAMPGEGVAVATGAGVVGGGMDSSPANAGRDVDTTARSNAIKQIQEIGLALQDNLQKRREQLNLDRQAIGLSDTEAEVLRTTNEVRQQVADTIDQLKQKRASLGKDEQYLIPIYNQQIKAIEDRTEAEVSGVIAALQAKQDRAAQDRIELQNLKQLVDLENLRAQVLGYSTTEQEKFNQAQAAGDFRNKTAAEIEQLRAQAVERDRLTGTLTAERIARETNTTLIGLETSILGRQFTELEKLEQLKTSNPEAFARKTDAETNALRQQAVALDEATAKYNALAFARDLQRQGEDFTAGVREQLNLDRAIGESARRRISIEIDGRNQLQGKLREIADRYGDEKKLSEELRQSRQREIDDATAGINKLIELKQKSVAEDQAIRDSFEFGWENAFSKYAEDALNAANQSRTYFETFTKGFEDAFVKFVQTGKISFKDLANSIIADFARIQAKKMLSGLFGGGGGGGGGFLGGIFGGIGKIFGFANGGNPGIGKPILVGERGPELMIPRNASTIVPNEALGGSNQTVVTYNIQAVDASSFRSMVARDPEFIYSVTEQGRKGLPNAGRRR